MNKRLELAIKNRSISDLEKKTGITRQTIYRLINGKNQNPMLSNCLSLCKELGYSLEYLFGDHEKSIEWLDISPNIMAMIKKEKKLKEITNEKR